jgi:hypothetical protein
MLDLSNPAVSLTWGLIGGGVLSLLISLGVSYLFARRAEKDLKAVFDRLAAELPENVVKKLTQDQVATAAKSLAPVLAPLIAPTLETLVKGLVKRATKGPTPPPGTV